MFAAQDLYYNVTINPAIAIFTYVLLPPLAVPNVNADTCIALSHRSYSATV